MLNRLKNFPLYRQLIIPIVFVGIIGLIATIYSAIVLEDSVSALGDLYVDGDKNLRVIEDLETSFAYFRAISLKHIASENSYEMSEYGVELDYTGSRILRYLTLVSPQSIDTDTVRFENTQILVTKIQEYLEDTKKIIWLSADFEKESAFELISQIEDQTLPRINVALQNLKRQEFENFSSLRSVLTSAASRNLIITVAIGIGGGGLVLLITFIIIRGITQRLSKLLIWSKEVASGNLSASLVADSNDEVGQLKNSMKEMANSIQSAHYDLDEAKINAEKVADELRIYANSFEKSGEAMLISDKQNLVININAAFTKQTGYSLKDVVGKNPGILASGRTPEGVYREMWSALVSHGFWQGELWDRKKNGEIYPKWIAISAIHDESGEVLFYIASFSDVTERKDAEARIEHLAHHDILTGLHNRFILENLLEQAISSSHRNKWQLAVLFIDLDRFKTVNDSLGHHVGDQLLIWVADRLRDNVRDSDIIARIGGDEFVIVLTGLTDNQKPAIMADKIIKNISQPCEISGHQIITSPSIGISVFPHDGDSVDDLLRTSDIAMYHAKESGRSTYHYFDESMFIVANQRLEIERDLRAALNSDQLMLHYQPLVHSSSLKIVTLEALIRWNHPEKGMISPELFIPIAEDTGIIYELGKWVITEACDQINQWKSDDITGFRVAINLSAKQLLSESLAIDIKSILDDHQIDGSALELEITETTSMSEPEKAIQQLDELRALGVNLSIDDFGTGYSSLAYLKRLPINTLKIDRSFVRDIETDINDAAICIATIGLAHNLGIQIVAEGVETEAQKNFLLKHDCDYQQGYYFGKPMKADAIVDLIRKS